MKSLNEIIMQHEDLLPNFMQWQIDHDITKNFSDYAETRFNFEDFVIQAALLAKEYIIVEEVILWKDHYSPENWSSWRAEHSALDSANTINHLHIGEHWPQRIEDHKKVDLLAEILIYYWNRELKYQFPDYPATNKYDGDVIYLDQGNS